MKPRRIPFRSLGDYAEADGAVGIFVGRFEKATTELPNRLRLHRHDYFELFLLDGKGGHFNDFRTFPIQGPTLVFVSPGQIHRWHDAHRLSGHIVCFTQQFFDGDLPPPSPLLKHGFWYPDDTPPTLPLGSEAADIQALFLDMEREFAGKERDFESAIGSLLRTLFIRAERLYREAGCHIEPGRATALVRDFRLALERNFRTTQSVSDYAKLLKVSADHLGEAVHERTGHPAGDLIRQRLLLEARRLLAHTEMAISEVAYALNFQDPAYFSRFFRRLTGQSPGEFRGSLSDEYQD